MIEEIEDFTMLQSRSIRTSHQQRLDGELAEIPEARKSVAPIDKAEASKVLDGSIWQMWFKRAWITCWTTAGIFPPRSG